MNKTSLFLMLGLISLFSACCRIFCKNDELSFGRIDHDMTKLKVHGGYYYYTENGRPGEAFVLCLYQNGVAQDIISMNIDTLFMKDLPKLPPSLDVFSWGIFKVEGNIITHEGWRPSLSGCLETYVNKGTVLNDTTYVITSQELRRNGRVDKHPRKVYNVYHFRATKNKPDSTNNFIR